MHLYIRLLKLYLPEGISMQEMAMLVPLPDDDYVDLSLAEIEFKRDQLRLHSILEEGEPSLEDISLLMTTHHKWCVFWSERHPDPDRRAFFAMEVEAQLDLDQWLIPKIEALIQRRLGSLPQKLDVEQSSEFFEERKRQQ